MNEALSALFNKFGELIGKKASAPAPLDQGVARRLDALTKREDSVEVQATPRVISAIKGNEQLHATESSTPLSDEEQAEADRLNELAKSRRWFRNQG